jgi:hypothetical protein
MKSIHPAPLLKFALVADAIVTGTVAALQLLLAQSLADYLLLPHSLLMGTGAFLAAYTLMLILLANGKTLWKPIVLVVVAGNVGWAIGCIALLTKELVVPNGLGVAFVLLHVLATLAFAALQFAGMKASAPAMPLHGARA